MLAKETFHVSGQTNPVLIQPQDESNTVNHGSNNFYCYSPTSLLVKNKIPMNSFYTAT